MATRYREASLTKQSWNGDRPARCGREPMASLPGCARCGAVWLRPSPNRKGVATYLAGTSRFNSVNQFRTTAFAVWRGCDASAFGWGIGWRPNKAGGYSLGRCPRHPVSYATTRWSRCWFGCGLRRAELLALRLDSI